MPTFIYAPGIKVYIQTAKDGLIDVSNDLSDGTMVRRSDGVSTFNLTVNNPRRKYDAVFAPNDRIVVLMKRLAWVRTFTGLLNSVPLMTVWPRDVPLAASCSLKRLQYWYWDPHHANTMDLIRTALAGANTRVDNTDGGITNVVITILEKVVGWPPSKVHIARIPEDWFEVARKIAKTVDEEAEKADAMAKEWYASLGGGGYVDGQAASVAVDGKLLDDTYGVAPNGAKLAGEQLRNAEVIYTVGKSMGMTDRDIACALACAKVESQIINVHYGDRDSLGLFQQRAPWGSAVERTTPTYAATKFYEHLKKVPNRTSMTEGQAVQAVQISAFPDRYQQWVSMGYDIVKRLNGSVTATKPSLATDSRWTSTDLQGGSSGQSTGVAMAQNGVNLVEKYPNIPYSQSAGSGLTVVMKEPPTALDCGTFVQACYGRTTGTVPMPRNVRGITSWCTANGGKRITVRQALDTPGAMLCKTAHHIEVSLGDGGSAVGAHRVGKPAGIVNRGSGNFSDFDYGLLLPGLAYNIGGTVVFSPVTGGGTATGGTAANAALANPQLGSDFPGYNPNDPFDKLFGNNSWNPQTAEGGDPEMRLAGGLSGIRVLLNDEPLLPYLKNLFNSTMRSFCSAPNGDLIAWFPDYYGLWGTAAKMVLEPIEVMDFTVEWSDDFFVTHQFTIAGQPGATYLDTQTGDIANPGFMTADGADIRTQTLGIASIDIPEMMYALFRIEATKQEAENFAAYIYKRFGARPSYVPMPGLQGPKGEFFSAMFMFMRQWAYQYNADIPLTFMPELFPGMLIQIPAFDFQAYVTTVTHTFRFGDGGGFNTTVNIAAPARLPKKGKGRDNVLVGLPLAGEYKPGRGVGNTQPFPAEALPAASDGQGHHKIGTKAGEV